MRVRQRLAAAAAHSHTIYLMQWASSGYRTAFLFWPISQPTNSIGSGKCQFNQNRELRTNYYICKIKCAKWWNEPRLRLNSMIQSKTSQYLFFFVSSPSVYLSILSAKQHHSQLLFKQSLGLVKCLEVFKSRQLNLKRS